MFTHNICTNATTPAQLVAFALREQLAAVAFYSDRLYKLAK